MNFKHSAITAAIVTSMGAAALPGTASAFLADGSWALTIETTPVTTTYYGATSFKVGKDGSWNSSFSFGGTPGPTSNGMTDNGTLVNGYGSSIGGDGFAGIIEMNVSGGSFTVGGTSMSGSVTGGGDMTFTPDGRLGAINAPNLNDKPWNINDVGACDLSGCTSNGNTTYTSFTTGSASAGLSDGSTGTINGAAFTNAGDLDGDGTDDWTGILVSGGNVGSDWGSFFGAAYFETWSVNILSGTAASGFNVDTIFATAGGDFAQYTSAVPVPAAVWLFGSGLMGLVGVARRKKA